MPYPMKMYVDGGCRRNGYQGAFGAAACVILGKRGQTRTWTRTLPPWEVATNQRAELTAIILALEQILERYRGLNHYPYLLATIYTDSKYVHGCMTDWIYKWTRNYWRNAAGNEVANRDLIEKASYLDDRVQEMGNLEYAWIPRSENQDADDAVNEILDEMESTAY